MHRPVCFVESVKAGHRHYGTAVFASVDNGLQRHIHLAGIRQPLEVCTKALEQAGYHLVAVPQEVEHRRPLCRRYAPYHHREGFKILGAEHSLRRSLNICGKIALDVENIVVGKYG